MPDDPGAEVDVTVEVDVVEHGAGLDPLVPIAVTCIVVPVVNYVVLERWVFGARTERRW